MINPVLLFGVVVHALFTHLPLGHSESLAHPGGGWHVPSEPQITEEHWELSVHSGVGWHVPLEPHVPLAQSESIVHSDADPVDSEQI
jgi:hypothetical protein